MKTEYITVDFDLKTNGECDHIIKELEKIEKKEFLIGYRAGSDQPAFNDRISSETARKAADLGIDIGICIYPASDDPEMYFNQN